MSNLKHTPAPWVYIQDKNKIIGNSWFCEPDPTDPDDKGIKTTVISLLGAMGGNDAEADAKLIAAAPELLEALQKLLKSHTNLTGGLEYTDIENEAYNAIKKATE